MDRNTDPDNYDINDTTETSLDEVAFVEEEPEESHHDEPEEHHVNRLGVGVLALAGVFLVFVAYLQLTSSFDDAAIHLQEGLTELEKQAHRQAQRSVRGPITHFQSNQSPLPLNSPMAGHIFLEAGSTGMSESLDLPWVTGNALILLDEKPVVPTQTETELSTITVDIDRESGYRVIDFNSIPSHPVGEFPILPGTQAFQFDRNPASILEEELVYYLPLNPSMRTTPSRIGSDGLVGIALSGAHIYSALNEERLDAVRHDLFDECGGHPNDSGRYHYHAFSNCFQDTEAGHSALFGYALDGFGIYGPYESGPVKISNDQLDECHGHVGLVPGQTEPVYHYHANDQFPYTVGCFRGDMIGEGVSPTSFLEVTN